MDFATILASIIFSIILAMLWGHPVLRKSNKVWFIAWKTVPAGCLTMLLLPGLCYELLMFLRARFGLVSQAQLNTASMILLLIGLFLGITVIVLLTRHILRREQIGKEWYALPSIAVFVVCGILGVVLNLGEMAYSVFNLKNQRCFGSENVCWLPKPQDSKASRLALIQQSIHPYFAEYDYTLLMRGAAENGGDKRIFLATNFGGKTRFNLYRLRDGRQFWQDKENCFLIDPIKNEVLRLNFVFGALYGANISDTLSAKDFESNSGWSQDGDGKVFYCDKSPAIQIDPKDFEGKIYFGAIAYDFFPAEKMPEELFPAITEPTQSTSIEPSGR